MYKDELKEALEAAKIASKKILEIYHTNFNVEIKSDDSPVTEADKKADVLIRKHLGKAFPKYAFLTEESIDDGKRLLNDYVWIIDPLDGTSDFVNKDGEFTVNIALCYKHEYTKGLLKSIPRSADKRGDKLIPIEGNPVDVFALPKGCAFAPRCEECMRSIFHIHYSFK